MAAQQEKRQGSRGYAAVACCLRVSDVAHVVFVACAVVAFVAFVSLAVVLLCVAFAAVVVFVAR